MPQSSASEYLRHGQTPFFRLPAVASPDETVDAMVIGVPHDGGTTYQPGARFAPYHVRRTSALVQTFHPTHRVDVFDRVRAIDAGNVVFPPFSRPAMREAVSAMIGDIAAARAVPFVVGGDHSITAPILKALAATHGPLAVLHVDAHLDTSGPETWGDDHHHGTPIRHALSDRSIAPGSLAAVGIRAPWGADDDAAIMRRHDALIASPDDVASRGVGKLVGDLRERFDGKPLYITIDVDGLDPAFAPGTGTPVPGGLTTREVLGILRGLAGANLVGMDVVEISPGLDHADLTCHLGAHLLFEGLALLAVRR
jgi:agmatinase